MSDKNINWVVLPPIDQEGAFITVSRAKTGAPTVYFSRAAVHLMQIEPGTQLELLVPEKVNGSVHLAMRRVEKDGVVVTRNGRSHGGLRLRHPGLTIYSKTRRRMVYTPVQAPKQSGVDWILTPKETEY